MLEVYNKYPYNRSRDNNYEEDDRETIEKPDGDEYEEYRFPETIENTELQGDYEGDYNELEENITTRIPQKRRKKRTAPCENIILHQRIVFSPHPNIW